MYHLCTSYVLIKLQCCTMSVSRCTKVCQSLRGALSCAFSRLDSLRSVAELLHVRDSLPMVSPRDNRHHFSDDRRLLRVP